jgi:hypothetical protein
MRGAARWVVAGAHRTIVPVVPLLRAQQRGRYARLVSALRRTLRSERVGSRNTSRSDTPTNEASTDEYRALINRWTNWLTVPEGSSAAEEDEVLAALRSHLVEILAPWDGTEGAVSGLQDISE